WFSGRPRLLAVHPDESVQVFEARGLEQGRAEWRPLSPRCGERVTVERTSFSPDGSRLVTSGPDGARVWSAADGQPITPLLPLRRTIDRATFGVDGRHVLTWDWSGTWVQGVFDADTGARVPLVGDTDLPLQGIRDVLFAPDGRCLFLVCDT